MLLDTLSLKVDASFQPKSLFKSSHSRVCPSSTKLMVGGTCEKRLGMRARWVPVHDDSWLRRLDDDDDDDDGELVMSTALLASTDRSDICRSMPSPSMMSSAAMTVQHHQSNSELVTQMGSKMLSSILDCQKWTWGSIFSTLFLICKHVGAATQRTAEK